jgi:hypothetical protein
LAGAAAGKTACNDHAFAAALGTVSNSAFTGTNRTFTTATALSAINASLTAALGTFLTQLPIGHTGAFASGTFENFISPTDLTDAAGPATPALTGSTFFRKRSFALAFQTIFFSLAQRTTPFSVAGRTMAVFAVRTNLIDFQNLALTVWNNFLPKPRLFFVGSK